MTARVVATEAEAPRRSEGEVAKVTCVAAPKIWRTPGSCYARIRQTVAKESEKTFLNLRITASRTRLGARVSRHDGATAENPMVRRGARHASAQMMEGGPA